MTDAGTHPRPYPGLVAGRRQPDRRTCGPSCLVAARMITDAAFAASVEQLGWDAEVLATHRRVAGTAAADGGLQLPWPRVVGTPPWALARELSSYGTPHGVRWMRSGPARSLPEIHAAVAAGHPVALYVGDRWLARHVVLVVDQDQTRLRVYEPARGSLVAVSDDQVTGRRLSLAGWSTPWFTVLPRRTPA